MKTRTKSHEKVCRNAKRNRQTNFNKAISQDIQKVIKQEASMQVSTKEKNESSELLPSLSVRQQESKYANYRTTGNTMPAECLKNH